MGEEGGGGDHGDRRLVFHFWILLDKILLPTFFFTPSFGSFHGQMDSVYVKV